MRSDGTQRIRTWTNRTACVVAEMRPAVLGPAAHLDTLPSAMHPDVPEIGVLGVVGRGVNELVRHLLVRRVARVQHVVAGGQALVKEVERTQSPHGDGLLHRPHDLLDQGCVSIYIGLLPRANSKGLVAPGVGERTSSENDLLMRACDT